MKKNKTCTLVRILVLFLFRGLHFYIPPQHDCFIAAGCACLIEACIPKHADRLCPPGWNSAGRRVRRGGVGRWNSATERGPAARTAVQFFRRFDLWHPPAWLTPSLQHSFAGHSHPTAPELKRQGGTGKMRVPRGPIRAQHPRRELQYTGKGSSAEQSARFLKAFFLFIPRARTHPAKHACIIVLVSRVLPSPSASPPSG